MEVSFHLRLRLAQAYPALQPTALSLRSHALLPALSGSLLPDSLCVAPGPLSLSSSVPPGTRPPPRAVTSSAGRWVSVRCFEPGRNPDPDPSGPSPQLFRALLRPSPGSPRQPSCPSGLRPPDLPAAAASPSYPIRRGSAVTHRRASGWGVGMRSLPHRAHLPGAVGAPPSRASGGCFSVPAWSALASRPLPAREPAVAPPPPRTNWHRGVEP